MIDPSAEDAFQGHKYIVSVQDKQHLRGGYICIHIASADAVFPDLKLHPTLIQGGYSECISSKEVWFIRLMPHAGVCAYVATKCWRVQNCKICRTPVIQ